MSITTSLKAAYPGALATLRRLCGDLQLAEDLLHDAIERALSAWPQRGEPDDAVAWLVTTGRRRLIDIQRRKGLEQRSLEAGHDLRGLPPSKTPEEFDASRISDDLLRMIFTCCHPALALSAQVALTLKIVAGLSVAEIAAAFLVDPRALEQRITRAKRKIAKAGIPYQVPDSALLPQRLDAVTCVIYLIFNEGYSARNGEHPLRVDLCVEAIRLARQLHRLFRNQPEVDGLLALLLLQHARSAARCSDSGELITLEHQDRRSWNQTMISEGRVLVDHALQRKHPGPYQVQAAIAALHCAAGSAQDTDWAQIAELYAILERMQSNPVVGINRAVALLKCGQRELALELLESLREQTKLDDYLPFHVARGAALAELERGAESLLAYQRALELANNAATIRHLSGAIRAASGAGTQTALRTDQVECRKGAHSLV